jgi:hypothetical protein
MLVVVITLTTLTMTIAAYAGGDDNNDDNGDGNKQKAEESAAAIADCDDNEVEQAGFDCIAIATNDVELETPEEEPPEESATLSVCKEMASGSFGAPDDFIFTVTGNNPSPAQFLGNPNCVDVTIGPGEYAVSEVNTFAGGSLQVPLVEGECMQDPTNDLRATGEIQTGETQGCRFINTIGD